MRISNLKSNISALTFIIAAGFSSAALADGFSGGEINTDGVSYIGADFASGDASNATVSVINVSNASPIKFVYGGRTNNGNSNANTVTITGSALDSSAVFGGYSDIGDVNGNTVSISSSQINSMVTGGQSFDGNVSNNKVFIKDSTTAFSVMGAFTSGGDDSEKLRSVQNNSVEISGASQIGSDVWGANVNNLDSTAIKNSVVIKGGVINGDVYGARSVRGNSTLNTVEISDGTISRTVYGAYTIILGNADQNSVVMTGGAVNDQIIGGYSTIGNATNNNVNISAGTVGTDVIGGFVNAGGAAQGNKVEISGTAQITQYVVGGFAQTDDGTGTGAAVNNSVVISGGNIGMQVFGGRTENGAATGNNVTISAGTISGVVHGGYSLYSGDVSKNTITMTGGTAASQLIGGWATSGSATNNKVDVSGNSSVVDVIGGYSATGLRADGNAVVLSEAAQISGFAIGGYSPTGNAINNSVEINGGQVSLQVYGGRSTSGNVSGNKVIMTDGSVVGNVYGASADGSGSSINNSVTITGGSLGNDVSGAWSQTGEVSNNTVSISKATVERNVGGGYVENGGSDALNNSVTLSNSAHVKGYVFAGFTASGSANNNTISIENATVDNTASTQSEALDGAVYGGYTRSGNATGNKITLTGENITLGGAIYGGFDASGTGDAFTGNTLNLNGYRGSVAGIYNVENYNWILPKNVTSNDNALIHITGADAVNLDNTKHSIALYNDGNVLKAGDTIYLIDKAIGTPILTTTEVQQGQFLVYDMSMAVEGDDLVLKVGTQTNTTPVSPVNPVYPGFPVVPVEPKYPEQFGARINPRTKAFSEGRVASLGFTAQGGDLIATSIAGVRANAAQSDKLALIPFVVTEGSSQRYKTGSSVDIKGFHFAAGLATRHFFEAGHQLMVGAFFEYGQGTYDTFNSFTNYASVRGDGNTHYTGGGILGRLDIAGTGLGYVKNITSTQTDGLYIEASLRAGRVKNKYDASNLIDPEGYRGQYDSSVSYFGAHGAVGYVFNFDEKQSLDVYGRYLYTHMGSDTVTVGKDRLHFSSSTSSRIQLGGRYAYQYNEQVKPFVGAAYEYEAKGDASASAYNLKLAKPSLKGSTGVFEAGLTLTPWESYKNIAVDVKGRGYLGERQGGGGNIKLTATF